jgi:GT2 family glycosyltransferase
MPPDTPPIAVVLATRRRPESAARAVEAVLASDYPSLELHVVDQSEDTATRDALRGLERDPRLTVLSMPPRGLAAARNEGTASTKRSIVAFTDDDCEPAPGWLRAIAAAFSDDASVGVVFGDVVAGDYDRRQGFVPAFHVEHPRTVRSLARTAPIDGMGACMAVRRETWQALGGFDESLGAGSPLRSSEEIDLAARALLSGRAMHMTPAAQVTHGGFRTWAEGRATVAGYMLGLGAVHAKLIRLAGPRAVPALAALAWRWAVRGPVVDLNGRPPRRPRLEAFLHGVRLGFRTPLDPESGHFRRPAGPRLP